MNCSSVRNRPMDCAPVSCRCGRSISRPAFMCRPISTPSAVTHGSVAQGAILILPPGAQLRLFDIGRFEIGRRQQVHFAGDAVDDQRVAVLDDLGDIGDVADRGNPERARDDRDMARRARLFEHEAAQPRAIVVEQRRRAHRAGDEDRVLRQFARAAARGSGRRADAAGGWRCRSGRAGGRAGKDRSGAAVWRARRSAPARPPLPPSARSSPPRAAGAASRDRARSSGTLRARRDARPSRRRRCGRSVRRPRRASPRWRSPAAQVRWPRRRRRFSRRSRAADAGRHGRAPSPSAIAEPLMRLRSRGSRSPARPARRSPATRPEAIISASSIAVVCSASISSSE